MNYKGWRYYRDSSILWLLFFISIGAIGYSLQRPYFWVVVLCLWYIREPIRNAYSFAHPPRRIPWMGETQLGFREITFKSRDGLTLFGRFLPAKNKSAIILLHGLGGSNTDMLLYAEILASAGFGVFMIDLRAHGSSEGDTSTYGMREADDVAGAVDYLLTRADVHGGRIGVFGISLGAQAALRAALKTENIRALILDGLSPMILSDHGGAPHSFTRWVNYPTNWMYYHIYEFMIGGKDKGVLEVIGNISPRPILLIASGEKDIYFGRLFIQAANDPKELWGIPNGVHGAGILQNSQEYKRRLVDFFSKALEV